jgi:hypothetical protein
MRIAGLILGVIGGLLAGMLGMTWMRDANRMRELIEAAKSLGVDTGEVDKLVIAAYILLAVMVVGIVAGVLAFRGKGKIAAPLMILGAIAPALFAPKALVFTFILLLGGLLSFAAKPKVKQFQMPY